MKNNLKIAIQSKGRLKDDSLKFLRSLRLKFTVREKSLFISCTNFDLTILFLRNEDIPEYVGRGVADFGIVGENILAEKENELKVVQKLGFGTCFLVIAIPKLSNIKTPNDLEGGRIATSYPQTLTRYLRQNKISATVITLRGSVEIAPSLNLADAICDLTQTGTTLREQGLVPLTSLLQSEAILVESPFPKLQKDSFLSLL
ncbi:MAG: ATP phosphoribosyltransferase, ATP phosphoribosyltransferase [Candidatus Peregrinibacteria bacterium GW2011_GWF2_39_17]|nr:MAG: ATP phosphoribosyltransferase, ATP phosphoribosyltransferase [Candidatus Peregrinibacteria bacterium GW2011_GWF2_39_17]HCW32598.1 ATP phosphoribosyltransferase [Candidatus Peregrinibacteria bacterium]